MMALAMSVLLISCLFSTLSRVLQIFDRVIMYVLAPGQYNVVVGKKQKANVAATRSSKSFINGFYDKTCVCLR